MHKTQIDNFWEGWQTTAVNNQRNGPHHNRLNDNETEESGRPQFTTMNLMSVYSKVRPDMVEVNFCKQAYILQSIHYWQV